MTFAEKLDLLMKITNTTNSMLARNISMDASFISRLRRGIRTPAKNVSYIRAMAAYFIRNCTAEYQKAALWEAIKSSPKARPQETSVVEDIVYEWLREEEGDAVKPNLIDGFLNSVSQFQFKKADPAAAVNLNKSDNKAVSEAEVFYGAEGKQDAVLTFLSLVLQSKSPQTLLLYSDEDLGWLIQNPEFTLKWAALLAQVIRNGNRIKIIHTVDRGFDEMLSGIKEWVPLYMTGRIDPYYYPRIRDGLFRKTLFIAPDTAAITSSSIGSGTKNAANFLFTNKKTIKALIEEYNDLLSRCRMLMRVFTPISDRNGYLALLDEFEDEPSNTIIKTDTLTNITMPFEVVERMLAQMESRLREQLLVYQQKRIKKFLGSLKKFRFTEILSLPQMEEILTGKVVVNLSDMLNDSLMFYTPKEYCRHLQNIVRLLKSYNNYQVHLVDNKYLEGSMIYVREDVGVLVGKTMTPSVVFAINESNMTAAFWDYMNHLIKKEAKGRMHRKHTIAELETIVAKLEEVII
ncbi:MAG: transcriptional regulator [Desulfotomaculaceae bacterium]|nr:transcriptional regulator [Desulfotomaculaceae bacterium]